jgi:hypothetical protein
MRAFRNEWIYATPAQENYIRRLQTEAAPLRCAPYALGSRRLLKSDAARVIDDFKTAITKAKGGDK